MRKTGGQSSFYLLLLLVALVPLFAAGLSNHGVWTPDEPRVAEIGREMALNGNWAVPMLNQRPFLEHPPLYYAAIAGVFKALGGASDRTVRIPSAVFAFGTALLLFLLGSMFFGPRAGFLAAFVMATCGEYFRVAHWVVVDSALAFFVVLSLVCFIKAYFSEARLKRLVFYGLCYISCALAFLTKGFIGVAIPAVAVLSFLVFDRNLKEILKMHLWLGILIFLAVALPWFLALWHQGGAEHLRVFLVHNHLGRFAGGSTGHNQPFYYYLTGLPAGFLPWSILLVPVLYRGFRRNEQGRAKPDRIVLFAKCWLVAGFLLLSAASTKRILYLMPVFAPISLLTARYVETTLTGTDLKRFERVFNLVFGGVIAALCASTFPLLFYVSRRHVPDLSTPGIVWALLLSLAALALSIMAVVKHGKSMGRFWSFSAASIFTLLLLGLTLAVPLVDRYKSFVPFCDAVRTGVPVDAALYAYKPDETLRGAVPFYTDRFLKELGTASAMEETLRNEGAAFVVVRDKRRELERELGSAGRVSVLARSGPAESRNLVLLRLSPPARDSRQGP